MIMAVTISICKSWTRVLLPSCPWLHEVSAIGSEASRDSVMLLGTCSVSVHIILELGLQHWLDFTCFLFLSPIAAVQMHVSESSFYSTKWLHVCLDLKIVYSAHISNIMFSFDIFHIIYLLKSIEELFNSYWIFLFQLQHVVCNHSRMNNECYLNLLSAPTNFRSLITNHHKTHHNSRVNVRGII